MTHDDFEDDYEIKEFAWSPDGSEIALVTAPTPSPEDAFRLSLVVVGRGTGAVVRTLSRNVAFSGALRWSPDGRTADVL